MPDYVLDDPLKVAVRLTGEVLDENYTQMLLSQAELDRSLMYLTFCHAVTGSASPPTEEIETLNYDAYSSGIFDDGRIVDGGQDESESGRN